MLKKLFALMLMVGLLGLTTGCPSKDKKKTGAPKATGAATGGEKTGGEKTEGDKKTGDKPAEAKLELAPVADVTLAPGKDAKVPLKITRTGFKDEVTVKFDGLPDGVTADEVKIPEGKDDGEAVLKAKADAKEVAAKDAKAIASGGGKTAESTFKVTVKK